MQKLKELLHNFGLTSSEIRVALFLTLILFAGSIIRLSDYSSNKESTGNFDYSTQDSLFYIYDANVNESPETVRNVEKKIAYEQELLDFTDDNFSKRDKSIPKIYEKSININLADESSLILLPSIGEKTARKIINYRSEYGKFERIEDIQKVKGIGKVKFEKIKKYIDIK
jgi:competence protein ComEA